MDFTIEKLSTEILPQNDIIANFDNEVLLGDITEHDLRPPSMGLPPYSFVIRCDFVIGIFCRDGTLKLRIDLTDYVIEKNNLIILVPGVVCDRAEISPGCRMTVFAIKNAVRLKEPDSNIALIPRIYLSRKLLLKLTAEEADDFLSIYYTIRKRIQRSDYSFKREIVYNLIMVLYVDICNIMEKSMDKAPDGISSRNKKIYDSFMDEMFKAGGKEREVIYYADRLCLTPKYLSRVVKSVSGRFAKDWIRDFVILQAKTMLDSGVLTIQQVSDRLNFPNQSFFSTYFKSAVGCSPKAYMGR